MRIETALKVQVAFQEVTPKVFPSTPTQNMAVARGGRWIWFKPGRPARALTPLGPGLVGMSKAKDLPKGKMLRNCGDVPNFCSLARLPFSDISGTLKTE